MTFTEAAAEVLRQVGRPLHFKEITAYAIEKSLLSHVGKSPEVTMGSRLAALFKKPDEENTMVRIRPGFFALKAWEESGELKEMIAKTRPTARTVTAPDVPSDTVPFDALAATPEPASKRNGGGNGKANGNGYKLAEEPADPEPEPVSFLPIRRISRSIEPKPFEPQLPTASAIRDTTVLPSLSAHLPTPQQEQESPVAESLAGDTVLEEQLPAGQAADLAAISPPNQDFALEASVETDVSLEADDEGDDDGDREDLAACSGAAVDSADDDEDDDEYPIFQNQESGLDREGSRRRRRRRRRSRGADVPGSNGIAGTTGVGSGSNVVAYSAAPTSMASNTVHSDVPSLVAAPEVRSNVSAAGGLHPVVLEVGSNSLEHVAIDDFGGKDMADAIALVLAAAAERAAGPVSLRQLAETVQRRGRLAGDLQQLQSQIAASVRADNLRRVAAGQRPRFRFVAGRVASTDSLLNNDLARFEADAVSAVERYREAARKAFVRKLQELPGPAFVELVVLLFERMGFRHFRAVRRAGIPAQESHFTAMHETGAGQLQSVVVIRRDGRDIGRERVAELRGAFHHYGPAVVGWLVTAGPVLSGAREEAMAPNASSVILYDGFGIARLCELNDIAVVRSTLPICIPDLDILEALRSS